MLAKRFILWGLVIILAGLSIYFIVFEISFQRKEPYIQQIPIEGWKALDKKRNSCGGRYEDIAIDPQGKIWMTGDCVSKGIHVFDGIQWRTYLDENRYEKIAIDSLGQVGVISEVQRDLVVFDGEEWNNYQWPDLPFENDEFVLPKNNTSFLDIGTIQLEAGGREILWVKVGPRFKRWRNMEEIHILQGETWAKCFDGPFTENFTKTSEPVCRQTENNVRWENLDVGTLEIIAQINQTLQLREATQGYAWFIPSLFAIILLANYLDLLPSVLFACGVGVVVLFFFGTGPLIPTYRWDLLNPGVLTTYLGVLLAVIGGAIDKSPTKRNKFVWWSLILAIIGLGMGFAVGFGWYLMNWLVVASG